MTPERRSSPFLPTVAAIVLCLGAAFAAASHLTLGFRAFTSEDARRLRVAESLVTLSPLRVVASDGTPRDLWSADPAARAWLVTFVYTRCPSACLALGSEFQQLQESLRANGAPAGVRLASLSFDRARDTNDALAGYAKRFRADPSRWLVAVPEDDVSVTRLLREAGVVVIDDGAGGYAHNAAIHVVTRSGRLVALFDLDRHREALAFAASLPP
jgi:protein SCO1/2